ncbi:hypothetical protein BS50DRAFT_573043 [Corynespora cassiicola Philippines]|uniref:Rhodopsin domain-containing protein n=1 Tax=Corynespora cassiicola Philippines TaxID=1448308 RepID=A0A2T2NRL9_CORCC|nr:hypothetical protein BS50DRAFT_573043 [Corynespora cassiicola Philippines]
MVEIGGSGRHRSTLPAPTLQNALKLSTASQIVCPLSASMSKLGILALYYQLFGQTSRNYRIAIKATFVLVTCVMVVQFIIPFANCKPFSKMWTPDGPGTCAIASLSLWRYLSLPNVFTTVLMIAIPFPKLFGLKVSAATKLGLAVILCVCVAGMVAAIMRVVSFLAVTSFHDITFENVKPFCWTITESGIYLIAGILPTLRPLMKKVFKNVPFDRILSASFRSSGSWGHKKGVFNKDKTLPELPKGQKPFTDMSSKGTVLVMMEDERCLMREDSR